MDIRAGNPCMKVLQVHNRYRLRGGEDAVYDATARLLQDRGVETLLLTRDSAEMNGLLAKASAFFTAVYSPASRRAMTALLARERPDVVHVHNLYPLLSPAVLAACGASSVPVVMTVHNYRLICPIGVHYRPDGICQRCAGGHEYWCAIRNCRDSRQESAAYAFRNAGARLLGLYRRNVTQYIAISAFLRDKLAESGIPATQITVVPNMVPATPLMPREAGDYVAFCGRLSEEKGVEVLLAAARGLPEIPVRIAGDGHLRAQLEANAPANVQFVGALRGETLAEFYRGARLVVVPSVWWETFGLVAVEAMMHGAPVVASRIGALAEIVQDGVNGQQFTPGDPGDLARVLRDLWANPAECQRLGAAGRAHAENEYNPDVHFERLMAVYQQAMAARAA